MTNNVLCEAYWKWQDVLMNHFVNFPGSVCCPCTQVPRHGIVKGKKWPCLVLHPKIQALMQLENVQDSYIMGLKVFVIFPSQRSDHLMPSCQPVDITATP